jgi:hypothetical protein
MERYHVCQEGRHGEPISYTLLLTDDDKYKILHDLQIEINQSAAFFLTLWRVPYTGYCAKIRTLLNTSGWKPESYIILFEEGAETLYVYSKNDNTALKFDWADSFEGGLLKKKQIINAWKIFGPLPLRREKQLSEDCVDFVNCMYIDGRSEYSVHGAWRSPVATENPSARRWKRRS